MSPDEEKEYYEEIQIKLKEISGVSYIKLAKKAFKYQKEQIGIKFLENEKSILTKVNILIFNTK
jgi:ribosomal protein L31E